MAPTPGQGISLGILRAGDLQTSLLSKLEGGLQASVTKVTVGKSPWLVESPAAKGLEANLMEPVDNYQYYSASTALDQSSCL